MEEIEFWAVETNSDLTEGRGVQSVAHICKLEATARRLARKAYVQGSDAPVKPVKLVEYDGKFFWPQSCITLVEPTAVDIAEQASLNRFKSAYNEAIKLGLSKDRLHWLTGGRHA